MHRVSAGAVAGRLPAFRLQGGYGLLSTLVAGVVGLFAVMAMVLLLAGTVGRGSTTIQMTTLSQGLRAAMQLMTRDLRRANYHSSFLQCFGNTNCRVDLGITGFVNTINIDADGDCFWYWLDRNGDANLGNDLVGAYRRGEVGGVGVVQMRIGGNDAAQCAQDDGWQTITDPNVIDITALQVSDNASYTEVLSAAGEAQTVEKIGVTLQGRMVRDPAVSKTITDLVHVRNDVEFAGPPST